MAHHPVLEHLRGGLVVSCQALPHMPLGRPEHLVALGETVILGGARGLRMEGPENLAAARARIHPAIPIIGLWKLGEVPNVFITPTRDAVEAVIAAGVDVVALDATLRPRPDGSRLQDLVDLIHQAGRLALGDVASVADAEGAAEAGVDAVATTLAGYTGEDSASRHAFDSGLLTGMVQHVKVPVLAEGHIAAPAQARAALDAGAWAVVVGTAITRPEVLARAFVDAVSAARPPG